MTESQKPSVAIIVAYNGKQVIGNNLGKVPWHIPADLKFFKETTMGHACIMGRNTWDSIPPKYKPLPGRTNIVVSRTNIRAEGFWLSKSVEDAIQMAKLLHGNDEEVFVTGGAQIYNYCLDNDLVDRVIASEIKNHLDVEGATFFPVLRDRGWTGTLLQSFPEFDVIDYRRSV